MYGDEPVSFSTLKSEMTHLRQHIGDALQARPYRLSLSPQMMASDAQWVEQHALFGKLRDALALYQHPLMPYSQAPAVVEYRDYLHQLVIRALTASQDIDALWQFTVMHEADYNVLFHLSNLLPAGDARHAALQSKLAQLDE